MAKAKSRRAFRIEELRELEGYHVALSPESPPFDREALLAAKPYPMIAPHRSFVAHDGRTYDGMGSRSLVLVGVDMVHKSYALGTVTEQGLKPRPQEQGWNLLWCPETLVPGLAAMVISPKCWAAHAEAHRVYESDLLEWCNTECTTFDDDGTPNLSILALSPQEIQTALRMEPWRGVIRAIKSLEQTKLIDPRQDSIDEMAGLRARLAMLEHQQTTTKARREA